MTAVLKDAAHHTTMAGAPTPLPPGQPTGDQGDKPLSPEESRKKQAVAAVTEAFTEHLDALILDAAVPGLRNDILQLLLPIEVSECIKQHTGLDWLISDPLPQGVDPESIIRIIRAVRTLTPMTRYTFKGDPLGIDLVRLQIRFHGHSLELTTTRSSFDSLEAPIGVWTSIFGSTSNKRSRAPRPR